MYKYAPRSHRKENAGNRGDKWDAKDGKWKTWKHGKWKQNKNIEIYKYGKKEIRRESLHYNIKGSALLFETRGGGCLKTKPYRSKHSQQDEPSVCCIKSPETTQYVVMVCQDIHPAENVHLTEEQGFTPEGSNHSPAVKIGKIRL